MRSTSFVPFALVALVLGACAVRRPERAEVVLASPTKGAPLVVAPAAPKVKTGEAADCLPPDVREMHLTTAWPESGRAYYCVGPEAWEHGADTEARSCWSAGPSGDLRHEPYRPARAAALPTATFRGESADGKLTFRIEGGLPTPKKAVGVLEQKSPRKVLKRAPIAYDEHIAFEGFLGQGIVYRTWVDEGPGCSLILVDPKTGWPSGMDADGGVRLGSCYGGTHLLRTRPDEVAVLDSGGSGLVFVNEVDLSTTELDLERQAGPDMGTPFVGWLEGRQLVLVYGAPISGDVVRVDLDGKRVVSARSPSLCEPVTKPASDPEPEVDF
jgi:hypothetical protein